MVLLQWSKQERLVWRWSAIHDENKCVQYKSKEFHKICRDATYLKMHTKFWLVNAHISWLLVVDQRLFCSELMLTAHPIGFWRLSVRRCSDDGDGDDDMHRNNSNVVRVYETHVLRCSIMKQLISYWCISGYKFVGVSCNRFICRTARQLLNIRAASCLANEEPW